MDRCLQIYKNTRSMIRLKTIVQLTPTDIRISSTKKTPMTQYMMIKKTENLRDSMLPAQVQQKLHNNNIFKNLSNDKLYKFDYKKEKPVGGLDTFMKVRNNKRKKVNVELKINTDSDLRKSVHQSQHPKRKTVKEECQEGGNFFPPGKQEFFKKHDEYSKTTSKHKTSQRPQTSSSNLESKHEKWANEKCTGYQNKMSFINELYYRRPLNERYGNRYFQYSLRNRYVEDVPPPSFVYLIEDQTFQQVQNSNFISKLRKANDFLKNRQKLVVKGRKIKQKKYHI